MSSRPRSTARAATCLRLASGALLAALVAVTAIACTQNFGGLVSAGGDGGVCMAGAVGGSCATPGGCPTCTTGNCELNCDICGDTCAPFTCTEPSCSATCTAGTNCEVTCPPHGDNCDVTCRGCAAHVRGATKNHHVNCDQHAACSLMPVDGQEGDTSLDCTSSSLCSARTSGVRFTATCSGQSTCVVECGVGGDSPDCTVNCYDSTTCRLKCPGSPASCKLSCGGREVVDCGDGWSACEKDQCPP